MSSAKEKILEDVEESRSFMMRMNRTGEITEPCVDIMRFEEVAIDPNCN